MGTPTIKDVLVTFFMSEKCYQEFFVNFRLDVYCLKMVLGRVGGFWILFEVLLAQLLQLLTILWRGSAEGLSLTAVLLQLYAFSCPVVFAVTRNFPSVAWAEKFFLMAETAAVILVILRFRGDTLRGVLLLFVHCALVVLLVNYAPVSLIFKMQDSILPAVVLSKLIQAKANYCNGHTGQLSRPSLILSLGGALGRAFNYWNPDNIVENLLHIVLVCVSVVLPIQLHYYRRTKRTRKSKKTWWYCQASLPTIVMLIFLCFCSMLHDPTM
uniref:Mannose-P-dolichol utilization defect 1a n=1 Tax=Neogobius melanostomus TaxID=47308 RepID=A0A8C6SCT9_9GOBI